MPCVLCPATSLPDTTVFQQCWNVLCVQLLQGKYLSALCPHPGCLSQVLVLSLFDTAMLECCCNTLCFEMLQGRRSAFSCTCAWAASCHYALWLTIPCSNFAAMSCVKIHAALGEARLLVPGLLLSAALSFDIALLRCC